MEILNNDLNDHDKNNNTTTSIMVDTNYNYNNHHNENNYHQNSDINTCNINRNNHKTLKNHDVINDDTTTATTIHHIKSHNDDEPEIVMSFRTGNIFSSHILLNFYIPFIDISHHMQIILSSFSFRAGNFQSNEMKQLIQLTLPEEQIPAGK